MDFACKIYSRNKAERSSQKLNQHFVYRTNTGADCFARKKLVDKLVLKKKHQGSIPGLDAWHALLPH